MKIAEVLEARGSSLREVAKKMEMKPSTLQATIDRNPTISTLRKIAEAAGCMVAEFFADELAAAGFEIVKQSEQQQPAPQPADGQQGQGSAADELPFNGGQQPTATMQQAIICPHCHSALVFNIAAYE